MKKKLIAALAVCLVMVLTGCTAAKEFTLDDFSHERLWSTALEQLKRTIETLNAFRNAYNHSAAKGGYKEELWRQMIQLLPQSYNQRRTLMLNYEVLATIYRQRKDHRLAEWNTFCDWIETLPYAELIVGR